MAGVMHSSVRFSLPVCLAACAVLAGPAPAATWHEVAPASPVPAPRRDAAMHYDRVRHRVLLFGGRSGGDVLDDTWALDLATLTWQPLATDPATRPEPRFSMVSGIDAARDRLLIASGQGTSTFFNDAWSFDLASNTWTLLDPAGIPPHVRYGSAGGTFDPGGFAPPGASLFLSHGFTDAGRFDDTWSLDVVAEEWLERTPAGTRPVKRCLHGAALVGPSEMVLFGGCASGFGPCPLGDTWRYDDTSRSWTELTPPLAPAPRIFPSLARMGDGREVLLFGGRGSANRNDLWRLDLDAGMWTQLAPGGTPPSPRQSASLVWIDGPDPALSGAGCGWALLFGGADDTGDRNDLWVLLPDNPPAPPSIRLDKDPTGVEISWEHSAQSLAYEVWRSEDPRFVPGAPERLAGDVTLDGATARFVDPAPDSRALIQYYRLRLARCGGF